MSPARPADAEVVRPRAAQETGESPTARTGLGWQPCLFFVDEETGIAYPNDHRGDHVAAAGDATGQESGYDLEQGW